MSEIRIAVEPRAKRRGGVLRCVTHFQLLLATVFIAVLGSQAILLCLLTIEPTHASVGNTMSCYVAALCFAALNPMDILHLRLPRVSEPLSYASRRMKVQQLALTSSSGSLISETSVFEKFQQLALSRQSSSLQSEAFQASDEKASVHLGTEHGSAAMATIHGKRSEPKGRNLSTSNYETLSEDGADQTLGPAANTKQLMTGQFLQSRTISSHARTALQAVSGCLFINTQHLWSGVSL